MRKENNYKVNRKPRKGGSMLLPALCMVLAAGILAFAGAVIWNGGLPQMPIAENSGASQPDESSQLDESSQQGAVQSQQSSEPGESQDGRSSQDEQNSQQSSSAQEPQNPDADSPWYVAGAVPKGERVNSSYFDDAMFVGDSITYGILSYEIMQNTTVVASTGINLDTIGTREVYRNRAGEMVTILDGMKDYPDMSKIYVMLGSNGIAWLGKDIFLELYEDFLDTILERYPNSIIYVQSILPVTKAKETADDSFANAKIDEYNEAVRDLALSKGCYYLNVAEAFKDEEGCLPADASPKDGMHFGTTYYQKWFDYLKTHTVKRE